ncbi:putative Ig domain-containing protein, partial [Alphaproteobacteria bacterium]|nr:putative Ig domain-containing protein [Alphaproteobacteria bacterium]
NIIFKDEIKLQYEIDTEYSQLWREAANKLLDQKVDADPDIEKLQLTGWDDDYFASESAYNAAVSSGNIKVQQGTSYDQDMMYWNYEDTDIAPPSYSEVKVKVDGWVDSLTLEKDTITFEKGSTVGADDNIVLSVVEGEEIPDSIRLRETNNNWSGDHGSVRKLYFQTNEVSLSSDGEMLTGGDGELYFRQGEIFAQSDKNIISFSISDYARNIIFKDEIKLQYEIDTEYSQLWREAANKLLDQKVDADPDIEKLQLTGWDDDYFASESAYNAAVSSGNIKVQQGTSYDQDMMYWNYEDTDIAPPSYSEVKVKVDGWVDSLTLEKDTITFEKGSTVGADDNIVLSVVEGEEIPDSIRLRETNNNWSGDHGSVRKLYFQTNEVSLSSDGEMLTGGDGELYFRQGIIGLPESNKIDFPTYLEASEDTEFLYELDIDEEKTLETLETVGAPEWVSVNLALGVLSGTPLVENVGVFSFELKGTYVDGTEFSKQIYLNVENVNDAPTIDNSPPTSVAQDSEYFHQFLFSDEEDAAQNLSVSLISGPAWLELSEDGLLSGIPENDDAGPETITVRVTDSAGVIDERTFSLTVNNTNDAPVLEEILAPSSTDEDALFEYQLTATDIDMDVDDDETLTYEAVNTPDWMSVSSSGLITGTPENDDVGAETITVRVTDSADATDERTFSLTISNTNDVPVLTEISAPSSTDEDALFEYQLTATDIDMDVVDDETLTYEAVNTPDWMSVSSSGLITGTPENEDVGAETITVKVTDSTGAIDEKTFSLIINNTNDAPVIKLSSEDDANDWYVAAEDAAYVHQLSVSDVDADDSHTFTYEIVSFDPHGGGAGNFTSPLVPVWFSLDPSSGLITGMPDDADAGEYRVIFSVSDAEGATSFSEEVSLWAQNVNDPVYIDEGQLGSFRADKEGIYQIVISDEDLADSYTFTADDLPDWLYLDPATGVLTGTPTRADDGIYTIDVT